jgi:hypothetical protein
MAPIAAKDWLEHHNGRTAQDCAVRLAGLSHAILPTDIAFSELITEQIKADVLTLAFHARKFMERTKNKGATVATDPLWPASQCAAPTQNLRDLFGQIIHADVLEVVWETPDLTPNPYPGRKPQFAAAIEVRSGKGPSKIPIGAIIASFIGPVLNSSNFEKQ